MKSKIVITAALVGGYVLKEHNPNVPYTPQELISEAKKATIEFGTLMKEKQIKPEFECFALSHVHNILFFIKHYDFLLPPLHFSMVFGVTGGVIFNSDILNSFIHAIPTGSTWQGIGVGPLLLSCGYGLCRLRWAHTSRPGGQYLR